MQMSKPSTPNHWFPFSAMTASIPARKWSMPTFTRCADWASLIKMVATEGDSRHVHCFTHCYSLMIRHPQRYSKPTLPPHPPLSTPEHRRREWSIWTWGDLVRVECVERQKVKQWVSRWIRVENWLSIREREIHKSNQYYLLTGQSECGSVGKGYTWRAARCVKNLFMLR